MDTKEELSKPQPEAKYPSFSLIFETENLLSVELENIFRSLASLNSQDISLTQANEFLIIDSGSASADVIAQICSMYPWVSVKQAPGIRYYEAKMMGAAIATGEIIIYCDSDCVYVSSWLRNILSTFSQNPDIHIVAGETSTPVRNIYELAIALHYFFPRFTNQENVYESDFYFLNNVAFRRDFLLNHPIPTGLPLYRGNCTLHAYTLSHVQSSKIWKHPQSKSTHEPPTSSFSFWRYLLMGRDFVLREHIKSQLAEQSDRTDHSQFPMALSLTPYQKLRSTLSAILRFRPFQRGKIIPVLQDQPSQLLLIPFAMPIMLWFELLYTVGKIITYWQPDWILKRYSQVEGELN